MKPLDRDIYKFGPFCLDVEERVLLCEGRLVPLPAKAVSTLSVLVRNRGHVVEKDFLMSEVWPDEVVEEGNLAQQIFLLRRALGEATGFSKYIETVPRRGYRFLGFIKRIGEQLKTDEPLIHLRDPGIEDAGTSMKSLMAVLPFTYDNGDEALARLGRSLTENLIKELSQLHHVLVSKAETEFIYSQPNAELSKIGRQLRVQTVLVGRLRTWGEKVIISAELIEVTTGKQLWSGAFNTRTQEVVDIQEKIVTEISVALQLKFIGAEEQAFSNSRPKSRVAYQNYLKGQFYCNKRSEKSLKKSLRYFSHAITLDPNYAEAHAGLADCYNIMGFYSILKPDDAFPRAQASATQALAIDNHLAEAHVSLGLVKLLYDWDLQGAEECAKQAIHLNPNSVVAYLLYGCHLVADGRFEEAIASYQRALQIDPLSLIANARLGYGLYFARRYDQAIKQCTYTTEMDDHFELAHVWLGCAYEQVGKFDDAIHEYQRALALSGGRPDILAAMAGALARSGKEDQSRTILAEVNAVAKQRYVSPYAIARIHSALGEMDRAVDCLEQALQDRSHQMINLKVDPKMDYLRSDCRVEDLIARTIAADRLPKSGEGFTSYRDGRSYWISHSREGLEQAADCFERAVESDQDYVGAYAALIDCYLRLATNYFLPANVRENPSIKLRLSDGNPIELQAALELRDGWDRGMAKRENQHAFELNFQYPAPIQWHAAYVFSKGLYLDSLTNMKEGLKDSLPQNQQPSRSKVKLVAQPESMRLTPAEEIQVLCVVSRNQLEAGNIDAARLALSRWYKIGEWPQLRGLSPQSSADLLLTAGRLAGLLASARQLAHGQKHAQALLHGAITLFEQLGLKRLAAEGRSELGRCYDREGLFDLARTNFLCVLNDLEPEERELKSRTLLRLAFAEMKVGHLQDSLARLNQASQFVHHADPSIADFFHIEMATTLGEFAIAENSNEYFQQASKHYEEALFRAQAVGHHRRIAGLANNHGYLLLEFRKLDEAESALMLARKLYDHVGERCPQLDETLARFHLEMGQFDRAERAIGKSVRALEAGGEDAVLCESLRTQGRVLCRLGRYREGKQVLDRAYQIADRCGDREGAGLALMMMAEETFELVGREEARDLATRLIRFLGQSQRADVIERLRKCLKQLRTA